MSDGSLSLLTGGEQLLLASGEVDVCAECCCGPCSSCGIDPETEEPYGLGTLQAVVTVDNPAWCFDAQAVSDTYTLGGFAETTEGCQWGFSSDTTAGRSLVVTYVMATGIWRCETYYYAFLILSGALDSPEQPCDSDTHLIGGSGTLEGVGAGEHYCTGSVTIG
jgi:hypothetical protein